MADAHPTNWLNQRYEQLKEEFGDRQFSLKDAAGILREKFNDQKRSANAVLSDLRKAGLLKTDAEAADNRRKKYTLLPKSTGGASITEGLFVEPTRLTRSDIEGLLKKAADLLRTRVDYKFI